MNKIHSTLLLAGCVVLGLCMLLTSCGRRRTPQMAYPIQREVARVAPSAPVIVVPAVPPRVMIMVDEQSLGTIATAEVEAMTVNRLRQLNVPVVDQDMVRATMARSQQMLQAAGDNRGAASLGAQFGADVVIIGEAVAKPSARRIGDTNLRSYQAVVTLRAVRADNASTLASASKDSTQVGLEDVSGSANVLRTAASDALDTLLPALFSAWKTPATAGASTFAYRIELTVGGVDQVWKLRSIRESLRGRTDELRHVTQRGYTAGMAEFGMESNVPSEELAEELVLTPPDGLRMQVLDIAPGRIQLRAVERD